MERSNGDGNPPEWQTLVDQSLAEGKQEIARVGKAPAFDGEPADGGLRAPAWRVRREIGPNDLRRFC
ncbi:MAG: hypothetical protein O3A96_08370 [Proteobacteria bacterium]|nr:hypothetical protein [Pseudomonadota bacterium]